MKIRGIPLVVAVLLAATACTSGYTDPSNAGEDDTAKAAIAEPQVAVPKLVFDPVSCEDTLPIATIGSIAGAPAKSSTSAEPNECRSEFLSADGSVSGQVVVRFDIADTLDGPVMDTYEGNTRFEVENVADNICDTGVAIDEGLDRGEFGSWLALRVDVENEQPAACIIARQLLIIAFDSLSDA